jgi:CheY-like chemotaxis protein
MALLPPRLRSLRVLLADDSAINQKVLARMLQRLGHTVVVAGDGQEALAVLESQPFDLVLMDVSMPVMDGCEAVARIREREGGTGRHTPIVAMTAHAMEGDREHCLAAGMDGYLAKPIQGRELAEAIRAGMCMECLWNVTEDNAVAFVASTPAETLAEVKENAEYPPRFLGGWSGGRNLAAGATTEIETEGGRRYRRGAEILRDAIGPPPPRRVNFDTAWLAWNDGCAVKMARVIRDERRFGDLPILADALEDAGCSDAELLEHLRGPGPHFRSCWGLCLLLREGDLFVFAAGK